LNYRNVNRHNFAKTVLYVANMLKGRMDDGDDPCEQMKAYLKV
jgi:hypothetical protein